MEMATALFCSPKGYTLTAALDPRSMKVSMVKVFMIWLPLSFCDAPSNYWVHGI